MIVIFKNLKNKRKLKIVKYNKKIKNRINITEINIHQYEILEEFNNKYKTNIEDIDIKELNIYRKK